MPKPMISKPIGSAPESFAKYWNHAFSTKATAGTTIDLDAAFEGIIDGAVTANGEIDLASGGRVVITANGDVESTIGTIAVNSASLKMLDGAIMLAKTGDMESYVALRKAGRVR